MHRQPRFASLLRRGLLWALALGLLPNAGSARAQVSVPPHVQAALDLLKSTKADNTSYQHQESDVRWQGDKGATASVCKTDCSGFVDAVLKRAYSLDDAQFKQWFGTKRPLAKHYHAVILEKKGFAKVDSVKNARPGDILAVEYPAGSENTGHVMLVVDAPKSHEATPPLVENTTQWDVGIIDVSKSAHGTTDTRHHADGKSADGLGRGVLRLYADPSGSVAGYSWSDGKTSKFEDKSGRNLVIGRLDPEFLKTLKK